MQKLCFNSDWRYARTGGANTRGSEMWKNITLPHDAQIYEPRSADYETGTSGAFFRGGFYRYVKEFDAPEEWRMLSVALEFEGVYQWAEIFLNGNLIAGRPYGYSGFIVNLKGHLKYNEKNILEVTANNSAVPNSRWYSGAGIYRHVRLLLGGGVYVEPWSIRVKSPTVCPDASVVCLSAEVKNTCEKNVDVKTRFTVFSPDGQEVAKGVTEVNLQQGAGGVASLQLEISPAMLWNVEEPNLYTLNTEIIVAGNITDSEITLFGIRKVEIDVENGFRLNGAQMKMKGGCVHHDNGLLGAASFDRAEERKVELMKAAGFNAIRCAHNPPSPAMLDACDRLGMLVINENFDCWRMSKRPNDYHMFFEEWWEQDTKDMIGRDFNHPSVIMWSIGNEIFERDGCSDGYAWSKRLADCVRSMDETRPITVALSGFLDEPWGWLDVENDRWGDLTAEFAAQVDVVGYNYLVHRYAHDHNKFPDRVICATESLPSQSFEYWNAVEKNPYLIGDFVWTSIDYLGEAGCGVSGYGTEPPHAVTFPWHHAYCGDFDICGFKRTQSFYRDILWGVRDIPYIATHHPDNFGKPVSMTPWGWSPVLESWSYPGFEGEKITVEVYSDKEEVELLINGKTRGRKPAGHENRNIAVFDVVYEPGSIVAIAFDSGKETGRYELLSTCAPTALRLSPDRSKIDKCGDLAYVTVEITDADGRAVKYATNEVSFTVSGCGELQAVGSGDPKSTEDYFSDKRRTYEGRAMVVVKSLGEAGDITIKATAESLADAETVIKVI